MVTHPSTNRARRRVTSLIETNVLPLSQAATTALQSHSVIQMIVLMQRNCQTDTIHYVQKKTPPFVSRYISTDSNELCHTWQNTHRCANCSHYVFGPQMFNWIQSSRSTVIHSLCFHTLHSNCLLPLAFTHAPSWQRHYLTTESMTDWSHSSTMRCLNSSTSSIFFFVYTFLLHSPYFVRKHLN